jgi:hypothetical protein
MTGAGAGVVTGRSAAEADVDHRDCRDGTQQDPHSALHEALHRCPTLVSAIELRLVLQRHGRRQNSRSERVISVRVPQNDAFEYRGEYYGTVKVHGTETWNNKADDLQRGISY